MYPCGENHSIQNLSDFELIDHSLAPAHPQGQIQSCQLKFSLAEDVVSLARGRQHPKILIQRLLDQGNSIDVCSNLRKLAFPALNLY